MKNTWKENELYAKAKEDCNHKVRPFVIFWSLSHSVQWPSNVLFIVLTCNQEKHYRAIAQLGSFGIYVVLCNGHASSLILMRKCKLTGWWHLDVFAKILLHFNYSFYCSENLKKSIPWIICFLFLMYYFPCILYPFSQLRIVTNSFNQPFCKISK